MENSKLEQIGSVNLNSSGELEEKAAQKIYVAHQINGLEYASQKAADSFIVDIERFSSHVSEKDLNANSRVALQRSLSRKGSTQQRGGDRKSNSSFNIDNNLAVTSPRASLQGASTPEKPMVVTVGATDHSVHSQVHNAITIVTGSSVGGGSSAAESKLGGRRFSFRRGSPAWTVDPRRILFFFATLSSMGTILLIYFTLSMSKLNGEDNGLN